MANSEIRGSGKSVTTSALARTRTCRNCGLRHTGLQIVNGSGEAKRAVQATQPQHANGPAQRGRHVRQVKPL